MTHPTYEWRVTFESGESVTVASRSIIWALESDAITAVYDANPDAGQPVKCERVSARLP